MRCYIVIILNSIWLNSVAQVIEKTYLTTDREIYSPRDTIWFKAYVFDRTNQLSDASLALHVSLQNSKGERLWNSSWQIENTMSEGYIVTPDQEGIFEIAAISGQMLNSRKELAFRKKIQLRSEFVDEFRLLAFKDFEAYKTEGPNIIRVYTQIDAQKAAPDKKLIYHIIQKGDTLKQGRFKTDKEGFAKLNISSKQELSGKFNVIIESLDNQLIKPIKTSLSIENSARAMDLQILPEGGTFISGISQNVAMKAIDSRGYPQEFKALILEDDKVIDTVESYYKGMASALVKPKSNVNYKLKVIEPEGMKKLIPFPEVSSGISLNLMEQQQRVIKLQSNRGYERVRVYTIQFDQIVDAKFFEFDKLFFLPIPKERLRTGLAKTLVTNTEGVPLAERVFFHDNQDQLRIEFEELNKVYHPRDSVAFKIRVKNERNEGVIGSFSISVVDTVRTLGLNLNNPNIRSAVLLSSEIKGNVPTPNFYFSDHPKAKQALDLILMTNGFRSYKKQNDDDPERLSGVVLERARKRKFISNSEVSLMTYSGRDVKSFQTNQEGRFTIPSNEIKPMGDSLILLNSGQMDQEKVSMNLDKSLQEANASFQLSIMEPLDPNLELQAYQNQNKLKPDRFNQTLMLNSVVVEGNKLLGGECGLKDYHFQEPWITKSVAELDLSSNDLLTILRQVSPLIYRLDTGIHYYIPEGRSSEQIHPFKSAITMTRTMSSLKTLPLQVYINCDRFKESLYSVVEFSEIDYRGYLLESLDFNNLETISIYAPNRSEVNALDPHRVVFRTFDNKVAFRNRFQKARFISYCTHYKKEFYAPKYDTPKKLNDPVPDLRTTIYWNANIITDENGEANVTFYNADRNNPIKIRIEGVDEYSRLGVAAASYNIERK